MLDPAHGFLDPPKRVIEGVLNITVRSAANFPLCRRPASDILPERRIIRTPGICEGRARFANTRIPVATVIKGILDKISEHDILADYRSLSSSDIQEAIQYYKSHKQEIDDNIALVYSLERTEEQELSAFLAELGEAKPQARKALKRIFSFVDQALLDERYLLCDALLDRLDPSKLNVVCALGFLAITLQSRNRLQHRASYTRRVEEWLRKERPSDFEGLLAGLR